MLALLLSLIAAGPCAPRQSCTADFTGDGTRDIADVLHTIEYWPDCGIESILLVIANFGECELNMALAGFGHWTTARVQTTNLPLYSAIGGTATSINTGVWGGHPYVLRANPTTTGTSTVRIAAITTTAGANTALASDTVKWEGRVKLVTHPSADLEVFVGLSNTAGGAPFFALGHDSTGKVAILEYDGVSALSATPVETGAVVMPSAYIYVMGTTTGSTGAYDINIYNAETGAFIENIAGTCDMNAAGGPNTFLRAGKVVDLNGETVVQDHDDWFLSTTSFQAVVSGSNSLIRQPMVFARFAKTIASNTGGWIGGDDAAAAMSYIDQGTEFLTRTDGTDYLKSTTLNASIVFNMQTGAEVGIPDGSTTLALQGGPLTWDSSGTDDLVKSCIISGASNTLCANGTAPGATANSNYHGLFYLLNPDTGTPAWSRTTADAAQVRAVHSTAAGELRLGAAVIWEVVLLPAIEGTGNIAPIESGKHIRYYYRR